MINIMPIVKNVHNRYDGNLCYYHNLVLKAPNAYGPYHNPRHMFHVPWEAYEGAMLMGLNRRDVRSVLIAGFMHDFDHTCTRNDDDVNIERAIRALDRYALEEDKPFLFDIRSCIQATRYPYKDVGKLTLMQGLLRDADQSQTFSPVWIQSTLYGLGSELGMSYLEMLKLQRPFLEKLKFETLWGIHKFEPQIPERLRYVDEMLEIHDQYPTPEVTPMS